MNCWAKNWWTLCLMCPFLFPPQFPLESDLLWAWTSYLPKLSRQSAYNLGDIKSAIDDSSDSEFSSEDDSDGEEKNKSQPKTTGPTAKGKIVKQGFLIKRVEYNCHKWQLETEALNENKNENCMLKPLVSVTSKCLKFQGTTEWISVQCIIGAYLSLH